jgi:predicted DNA-binding protein (MmcQ/YjbR family)
LERNKKGFGHFAAIHGAFIASPNGNISIGRICLFLTMPTPETVRTLALSLPEVTEEPHFEKTSFRVKKKIFMTLNPAADRITVKLTAVDQDVFSQADGIEAVPNKWGQQGWTNVYFEVVHPDLLRDVVETAYSTVKGK